MNNNYEELAKLIRKAKQGDMEAFQKFYEKTYKPLYFIMLKRAGNPQDAEDILQDVYIDAYSGLQGLKNDRAAVQWLNRIAYYKYQAFLKKEKRSQKFVSFVLDDDEYYTEMPDSFYLEENYIREENREKILEVVKELPEKQRSAIYLFYFQEFSTREMADICGCPETLICKRLFDARQTIKRKVESTEERRELLSALMV